MTNAIVPANGEAIEFAAMPVIPLANNKSGIVKSIDNVCTLIEHWFPADAIRYEMNRGRVVCAGIDPRFDLPDGEWKDAHTINLTRACERMGLLAGTDIVDKAVQSWAHKHAFSSVADFLDQCLAKWDGIPRVDGALARLWGCEDCPATTIASRILFLSLAARGYEPGIKVDTCVTFVGAQGEGRKSTSWRTLVGDEFFSDSDLPIGDKDAQQNMRGKWLWELSELASLSKRDRNAAKRFITERVGTYRASYARHAEDVPRLTVFVATTNDEEFLDDPTGNRRFPCVRVVGQADIAGIRAEREQLLGEAAVRVSCGAEHWPDELTRRRGFTWWPAADEERVLNEHRAQHEVSDPWTEQIAHWARKETMPFSTSQCLTSACLMRTTDQNRAAEMRASAVLRRLGYVKKQTWAGEDRGQRLWEPGAALAARLAAATATT